MTRAEGTQGNVLTLLVRSFRTRNNSLMKRWVYEIEMHSSYMMTTQARLVRELKKVKLNSVGKE